MKDKHVKGIEELISLLKKVPKELDDELDIVTLDNAKAIEQKAKEKVPIGTPESTGIKGYIGGSLKASIGTDKIQDKSYKVSTNRTGLAPYGNYVEYGTKKMSARPFLFPAYYAQQSKFIKDIKYLLDRKSVV